MNRASSERLAQAETLWAMLNPPPYPADKFEDAWNNVLLYSEHTWGACCSVSEPASPFTTDQWTIKQSYATAANLQSRQLLSEAAQGGAAATGGSPAGRGGPRVDVYNTTSWPRTEVVLLPHELSDAGRLRGRRPGRAVPAQRLASRELAVLVRELPPLQAAATRSRPEGRPGRIPGDRRRRRSTTTGSRCESTNGRAASWNCGLPESKGIWPTPPRPGAQRLPVSRRRQPGRRAAQRAGEDHGPRRGPAGRLAAGRIRRPRLPQAAPGDPLVSQAPTTWN